MQGFTKKSIRTMNLTASNCNYVYDEENVDIANLRGHFYDKETNTIYDWTSLPTTDKVVDVCHVVDKYKNVKNIRKLLKPLYAKSYTSLRCSCNMCRKPYKLQVDLTVDVSCDSDC